MILLERKGIGIQARVAPRGKKTRNARVMTAAWAVLSWVVEVLDED